MDSEITIGEADGGRDISPQEVAGPGQHDVTGIICIIDRSGSGDHLHESAMDRVSGENYSNTSGRRDE